ncbi:protein of unknown function DUF81 [Beutenbergia cavernae DSM 12333]|uniref:Probable membrane transporter protein n=1 Tax=Beutenbergia cavernae (strain ATCC BAA-8 / DSM 12333 / CCUG 43141 / JCM 11478 / NBRC 16432 / NCIMB 13614 / HKI 0122) TaxID=471853 RepID=C5BVS4_BEUC1|nr:sulfite exporter TauE/SafE family protein [Beutenbergia cavernae]ACQ78514.1 protein of unknown function DUF81 [Beutenbergia cavernae DSM 12333]
MLIAALVMLAVLVGASMQRSAGMGFAMVAAPFLVLLVGPLPGVLLVNFAGFTTSALILTRVWRDVSWRRIAVLVPSSLLGIVPGAFLAGAVDSSVLEIVVGAMVLLGLSLALLFHGGSQVSGATPLVLAGAGGGLGSVTAGVGGPAMSVYAILSRWDQRTFAATCQPFFMATAAGSALVKLGTGTAVLPSFPAGVWIGIGACLLLGLLVGEWLAKVLAQSTARRLMLTLAYVGSITTVVHGILALTGVISPLPA